MAVPSSAITRYELSMPFSEFDLRANQMGFIGPQVLVPRSVAIQAADVGKVPLKQLLSSKSTKRAAGAGYSRSDFEWDKYSYATEEYGHESALDDRQLAIYSDIIDAETIHAMRAADAVLQEFERDVAAAVFDTATWTGSSLTTAISTAWSTHASATPIDDIIAAREKVILGSGLDPNALILNSYVYWHLTNCAQIVDRVKYTATATQQQIRQAVAECLGVEKIIVAGGLKNTANPQQTAAISRIWSSSYAMLARVANSEDPSEPCIGRTFVYTGDGAAVGTGEMLALVTEEYREECVRGSIIRARNDRDIVIMYAQAGHLLSNATA